MPISPIISGTTRLSDRRRRSLTTALRIAVFILYFNDLKHDRHMVGRKVSRRKIDYAGMTYSSPRQIGERLPHAIRVSLRIHRENEICSHKCIRPFPIIDHML
eukprot:TRINITY_DN95440_c0_g1_i1.p1 TRINITY_DN95440_c0_g1~~TRINITY_DN95440_c0_g1_i1.p1  ORF type:complete len:103 (-),score=0.20 TRINITY_DN95440_c0_g1_i1:27-335(-)